MTITLTSEIENALMEQARKQGTMPERLALDSLHERFVESGVSNVPQLIEPRDDWERLLASAASDAGVSLSDEQVSRETIYADHD